jgi:hypothetical protein
MREPIGEYNDTLIVRTHALKSMRYVIQGSFKKVSCSLISRRILPSLQYHHLIDQFSNEESFQSADRNLFEPLLETLRR